MIVAVVGTSKTGKTTLVERVVRELTDRGISVASVKHVHGKGVLFPEGKDTTRHLRAGASPVVGVSGNEVVAYLSVPPDLDSALQIMSRIADPDVILVEGFKASSLPKIVLGNAEVEGEVLMKGDDPEACAEKAVSMIEQEVRVERVVRLLPGIDCRKCGYKSCRELAEAVAGETSDTSDCLSRADGRTRIVVDGRQLPLGRFVSDLVAGTVTGLVKSLKEVGEPREIEIHVQSDPKGD